MIKAIIFDADGPLYYRTPEITHKKQALLAAFGYTGSIEQFERTYEAEKYRGYVAAETATEMFRSILSAIGVHTKPKDAQRFSDAFDAIQRQVTASPGVADTLKRVKQMGYKTCVLTDSYYSSEQKWPWFKELGIDRYIDYMVSSYDIQKIKDTPGAYQVCLNALNVKPDEAVFVGHQAYEMVGARAANILSVALLPIATPGIRADYKIHALSDLPALLKRIDNKNG